MKIEIVSPVKLLVAIAGFVAIAIATRWGGATIARAGGVATMPAPSPTPTATIATIVATPTSTPMPMATAFLAVDEKPFAPIIPIRFGRVTQRFGVPGENGAVHGGVDYGCLHEIPVTSVLSPMSGKIVMAGHHPGGLLGNVVIVESLGGHWRVMLAHLAFWNREPGEIVKAGDVVGVCGSTGNSSGPHVHMEIHAWNGSEWVRVAPRNLPGAEGFEWENWESLP